MLYTEFTERTKFYPSERCYHEFIEPEYDSSTINKDEWCKQWKKNGGIAKAYAWEKDRSAKLQKLLDNAKAMNDVYAADLKLVNAQLETRLENIKDLQKRVKSLEEIEKKYNRIVAVVESI